MRIPALALVCAAALTALTHGAAYAETASESYARGEALLKKSQFSEALAAYTAAARAERGNREYLQRYALVRRVVDLRARLDGESDADRWQGSARALRAFYAEERLYADLLAIDRQIHQRTATAETAAMLAETQLALRKPADAAATLSALPAEKTSAMTQALLGIALARSGKTDEAKQAAAKLALPEDAGPSLTYAAARLHAGVGDKAAALAQLRACLEATLPSRIEGFRKHAAECPEFAAIASTDDFKAVLQTESKREESKCSGGSSCAGCPMSGKCPKSGAEH